MFVRIIRIGCCWEGEGVCVFLPLPAPHPCRLYSHYRCTATGTKRRGAAPCAATGDEGAGASCSLGGNFLAKLPSPPCLPFPSLNDPQHISPKGSCLFSHSLNTFLPSPSTPQYYLPSPPHPTTTLPPSLPTPSTMI